MKKISGLSMLFIVLLTFIISSSIYSQDTETNSADGSQYQLVNRKVIVLDFVYGSDDQNWVYLSTSLVDSIIVKLNNSGQFNVNMSRQDIYDVANSLGISADQFFEINDALSIAREMEMDVVVIGKYLIEDEELKIFAHAIDVETGRTKVSVDPHHEINMYTEFETIDNLAELLASEMIRELPPQVPDVIEVHQTKQFQFVLPEEDFPDQYSSVSITGEFTGWRQEEMSFVDGHWIVSLDMDIYTKNEFEYKYVVDGNPEAGTRRINLTLENGVLVEDIQILFPQIGVRAGGYFFFRDDLQNRLDMAPPVSIQIYFRMNIPIWDNVPIGFEIATGWHNYDADPDENPMISDCAASFINFPVMGGLYYDIYFLNKTLVLSPYFGGGALLISSQIEATGEACQSTSEFFVNVLAYVGISFGYYITYNFSVNLFFQGNAQFVEDDHPVYYMSIGPSINYIF